MKRTRGAAAGLVLALVTRAGSAHAAPEPSKPDAKAEAAKPEAKPEPTKREPSLGDLATARAALREGLALREKGDVNGAVTRLGSAYDLVPTPITGFELGKTHLMLGHVLAANELFKKVVRMPPSLEESARSQAARDEAARLAKEVEPRIPSLRLKLTLAPGTSAVVKVDDEVVTTLGPETVRSVEPGGHDVVARAGDGPEQKVHVEVGESEVKDVLLAPKWVPPKPPPTPEAKAVFVKQTNPLVFIGFGVSALMAVTSGVTLGFAIDARNEARDLCGKEFCPPRARSGIQTSSATIDEGLTAVTDRAVAYGLVSGITAAGAVLFFAVGVVGLTRPIKERVISGIQILPAVGLGSAGLTGTF